MSSRVSWATFESWQQFYSSSKGQNAVRAFNIQKLEMNPNWVKASLAVKHKMQLLLAEFVPVGHFKMLFAHNLPSDAVA